ncbi:MAG: hypothetical protein U0175_09305 [Caldilineaceae bacterium]
MDEASNSNKDSSTHIFQQLAMDLVAADRHNAILSLFEIAKSIQSRDGVWDYRDCEKVRIRAYRGMARGFACKFKTDLALMATNLIPSDNYERVEIYGELVESAICSDQMHYLQPIVESAWSLSGLSHRTEAFSNIAIVLATHLHLDKAREITKIALELLELYFGLGDKDALRNFRDHFLTVLQTQQKPAQMLEVLKGPWNIAWDPDKSLQKFYWLETTAELAAKIGNFSLLSSIQELLEKEKRVLDTIDIGKFRRSDKSSAEEEATKALTVLTALMQQHGDTHEEGRTKQSVRKDGGTKQWKGVS